MVWPAPSPGTPLEAEGDLRSRGMTVLDRIRLMTCSVSRLIRSPRSGVYKDKEKEVLMRLPAHLGTLALLTIVGCSSHPITNGTSDMAINPVSTISSTTGNRRWMFSSESMIFARRTTRLLFPARTSSIMLIAMIPTLSSNIPTVFSSGEK